MGTPHYPMMSIGEQTKQRKERWNIVNLILLMISVGPKPTHLVCPFCHAYIITKLETNPSTKTHIIALLLCFMYAKIHCLKIDTKNIFSPYFS